MNEDKTAQDREAGAPALAPVRQKTWPMLLAGALVLLSGIAIGVAAAMLWLKDRPPRHPRGHRTPKRIAARLRSSHGLTDAQTLKVEEAFRRRLQALDAIRHEILPRVEAEHRKLRNEMKAILTPEQFERWNTRFGALRGRWPLSRQGMMRRRRHPLRARSFEKLDKNGDGKLTANELPPELRQKVLRSDANKDGAVTREEWRHARPKMTPRSREPRTPGPPAHSSP